MAAYDVVFNRVDNSSSDAALHTKPTPTSEVLEPLARANVARVNAATEEDARTAVRAAYSGDVSLVAIIPVANWVEG